MSGYLQTYTHDIDKKDEYCIDLIRRCIQSMSIQTSLTADDPSIYNTISG